MCNCQPPWPHAIDHLFLSSPRALYMECAKMHFYSYFHGYLITAGILDNQVCRSTGKLVLVVVAAVPRIIWDTRNDGVSGTHRNNRCMMCCCDQTNWILDSLLVVFVEKGGQQISIAWGVSLFEQVANEVFGAVRGQKLTHLRLMV